MLADPTLTRLRPVTARSLRRPAALAVMAASGFAGLGYQIVWTQQSALWLGHESAAVLAVVAAFFGGLGIGALALGPRIDRSARPERWYAACELVIALWSVALAVLLAPVSGWLLDATGAQPTPLRQWSVAFVGTLLVLLPATAAMGATLPAMERMLSRIAGRPGESIAALYASNTFGAVIGVLAAAFWLVPQIGLIRTAGVCAGLNLLCAVAALKLPRGSGTAANRVGTAANGVEVATIGSTQIGGAQTSGIERNHAVSSRASLWLLAATGLLGIGYEVLVVRVLSQVAENTVYTFAMLLAVYLVGSALGAAGYHRWLAHGHRVLAQSHQVLAHGRDAQALQSRLLCLQGAACLLGTLSLWGADSLKALVADALGTGMAAALAAEATLALVAFALPTLVMGALFSHLAIRARSEHNSFGSAIGCNTLGAACAPLLFGVLLVPALGPKFALLLVAAGYLALALLLALPQVRGLTPTSPQARATLLFWGTAVAALALAVWAPPLAFIDLPAGGRVISYRDGAMGAISVVEDAQGVARLRIDNRQQEGSSATRLADGRQALLPLLLHPAPQRVLFLGLGTGVTASAAAEDPALRVDVVELLPEVIEASAHFRARAADASPGGKPGSGLHVMASDARRFIRTTGNRYDVIVSDNFHPARSGSGALYTVEHFQAVRARLSPQGLYCQWLPLHQLDLETLRSIVQAFLQVYPDGGAMLATNSLETPVLGLFSRPDAPRFALTQLRERFSPLREQPSHSRERPSTPAQHEQLTALGLTDEFALLGTFIAGPSSLARFAGDAPANTDDRPVVAYRAPRITYAPDSLPRDRLVGLLGALTLAPGELIDSGADAQWPGRIAAYWQARDSFIHAGLQVGPSADLRQMLSQVREPLLSVLRISPDFRPAYDPLLRMATELARTDPTEAARLLAQLRQLQPARPEAAQALARLAGVAP